MIWQWLTGQPAGEVVKTETMCVTAFDIAERYIGQREIKGSVDNHTIMAMLKLDANWPSADEVPWCSAFLNQVAWLLRLPRSKSLLARSWLNVGRPVELWDADVGNDIVILKRAGDNEPGPEDTTAKGHAGFYAGQDDEFVYLLGGNQGDAVNVSGYPIERVLGVRRLIG